MTSNSLPAPRNETALAAAAAQREELRRKVADRLAEGTAPTGRAGGKVYLRFNGNDGTLTAGRDKQEIPADQMFLVPLATVEHGVIEWASKAPTGQERMVPMVSGAAPQPPVNALIKGSDPRRPMDGWADCLRCELIGYQGELDGIRCEFSLHSQGGHDALAELARAMFERVAEGPEKFNAVVTLSAESYENRTYAKTIWVPVFTIVGWTDGFTVDLIDDAATSVLD